VHGTAVASGSSISYTPTAGYSGTDTFTYTASNSSGTSAPATVTVTVTTSTLSIAPSSLPSGVVGQTYNQDLTTSLGTAPYTYVVLSGGLPGGLALEASGSFNGTPTASGSFSFTVQASDSYGATGTQSYTLAIALPVPVANDVVDAKVAANSTSNAIVLSTSGTVISVAVASQAGHGTAVASGSSISYTPTAGYSGTDSFTYTASNSSGTSAPATVTVTITKPTLTWAPSSLSTGTEGRAYSQGLTVSQGTAPYSYAITSGSLPPGLVLNSATGQITGTPTQQGSFDFTVQATDSCGATGSQPYTLSIALRVPAANDVSASVAANSQSNTIALNITRAAASSVAVASQAVHGTAVASGSSISYTPTVGYSGTDSFTYTASNSSGTSTPATVTVTVTTSTLRIDPSSLSSGTVGQAYSQTLTASQGTGPYTYATVSDSLPAGLSLSSSGSLSGTPSASGSFSFTVQATDSYGATGSQSYTLAIALPVPVANDVVDAKVAANSTSNVIGLSTSGTVTSVAVASQAGHGTAVASGSSISYTPTAGYSGTDSFTYTASNSSGTSAPATVTVTITEPALVFASTSLPAGTMGQSYSQNVSAAQGAAPYSYTITLGSLPPGLSLNSATGQITGTPTQQGSFDFTVQATDSCGVKGVQSYTLQIAVMPVPVTAASSMGVNANSSANPVTLSMTGGAASSVTVVVQAVHGVAVVSGTNIAYTPTAGYSGEDAFFYSASNAGGSSEEAKVTITVRPPVLVIAPAQLPSATVGRVYSQGLSTSQGVEPYTYVILSGSLPDGLALSTSGSLSGTLKASGSFEFEVQVTDGLGVQAQQSYKLVAADPVPVANDVSATVQANSQATAVALNITKAEPSSVTVATPAAHGKATASGTVISYMPDAGYSGTDSFTYTASNASGTSNAATVAMLVTESLLVLQPSSLPGGTVGAAYSQSLGVSQGTPPYSYVLALGALPDGLTLGGGGSISGTPTVGGLFSFTVRASDSYGATGEQAYNLAIDTVTLVANPVSASVPANSQANPIALKITGRPAAKVAVASQASHGTALADEAAITYTPNVGYVGLDAFTYTASNDSGTSEAATVTVLVSKPLISVGGEALPEASEGIPYSQGIAASGGTAPYSFVVSRGTLPPGLVLSVSGQISGTPTAQAAGSFSFSVLVTDAYGASTTVSYTLRVSQVQPVAPGLSIVLVAGSSVDLNLTAEATGKPFTGAAVQSMSPAEAGQASIRRAPSATAEAGPAYMLHLVVSPFFSGDAEVLYTLSNTAGTSAPGQVHITITARADPSKDAEVVGIVAAQTQSAQRFASVQILNFSQRLESLHADGWGHSSFGLSLNTGRQPSMGQAYGVEDRVLGRTPLSGMRKTGSRVTSGLEGAGGADAGSYLLPDMPDTQDHGRKKALTFWTAGTIEYGHEYVRNVETENRFTTSGISIGADYRVSDLLTLGMGMGLGRDSSLVGLNGSKSVADSITTMLYVSLRPSRGMFVDGLLGYGSLRFDSTRYVQEGAEFATGTRQGRFMQGALIAGMEFRQPAWMWSPYVRLEVAQITLDAYSEAATGLAALTYFEQQSRSRNAVLGLRAEGLYRVRWGQLRPRVRLEYGRNMLHNGEAGLAYADLADLGVAYTLSSTSLSSDNWTLGVGARLLAPGGVELSMELNLGLASSTPSRTISLGLRVPF
jgi:uncharacterized protein YhjY with autotransporter beta-barrel domain